MRFVIVAAAAALLAAPAVAQTADSTAPAPKPKKEKKICRKAEPNSYSHMTPSICRTQAEWDRDTSNGARAGVTSMGGDNLPRQ
ncbi:MAG: hypothetical protein E7773_08675 [Sphingomonas sp.]|uniref:hypothetical protein n=1 Tax=Sphingomonas sp. TaxID=28214 RepID=UPI0011F61F16|nr:hypothetical protein [Sphingomonas sp.]THD36008.1 MAG: hypothetical protein E7773_08675 [Sphingomonas sp.]